MNTFIFVFVLIFASTVIVAGIAFLRGRFHLATLPKEKVVFVLMRKAATTPEANKDVATMANGLRARSRNSPLGPPAQGDEM